MLQQEYQNQLNQLLRTFDFQMITIDTPNQIFFNRSERTILQDLLDLLFEFLIIDFDQLLILLYLIQQPTASDLGEKH